ncbi:MAG: serine O-acetyltransferase EpsC [Oscillospiraceae bacterium]
MSRFIDDLRSVKERDPACRSCLEAFLLYSGFHAVLNYRFSHYLYRHKLFFLARCISQWSRFWTGIEIHPGADIGRGLFIDHGAGVVIGETAELGDYCTLYQGVTLGGTGKDIGKRHPTLGHNVLVGAGAKVLGPVVIGSRAKIAAGAVVLCDVPEGATAVGVPARIARICGAKIDEREIADLDHAKITDPVSQEFCRLAGQIEQLQKRIDKLEK